MTGLLMTLSLWGIWGNAFCRAEGLKPLDASPQEGRIPLILVHGINPDAGKEYNWQGFLNLVRKDPAFQSRFKTYLFVYDPAKAIRVNGKLLQADLIDFHKRNASTEPFRFAALSLGGMIVREALADNDLWQQTQRVVAISVPFHGTPLASKPWMHLCFKEASVLNPVRHFDDLAYSVAERQFPHFEKDYCWDNFDGNMPESVARQQTCPVPVSPHPPQEEARKYTVYAGFYGSSTDQRQWLRKQLGLPADKKPADTKQPMLNRHMMFSLVQPCLSALPVVKAASKGMVSVEAFNDGISPISSQLWLGRFARRGREGQPVPQERLWQSVLAMRNSENARLFDGLDHRDWLEGQTRYNGNGGKLQDWLHPDAPARNMFEWIKFDLMRN
jgi:hypothetical protein